MTVSSDDQQEMQEHWQCKAGEPCVKSRKCKFCCELTVILFRKMTSRALCFHPLLFACYLLNYTVEIHYLHQRDASVLDCFILPNKLLQLPTNRTSYQNFA